MDHIDYQHQNCCVPVHPNYDALACCVFISFLFSFGKIFQRVGVKTVYVCCRGRGGGGGGGGGGDWKEINRVKNNNYMTVMKGRMKEKKADGRMKIPTARRTQR
jgi:hypothetical protein